MKSYTQLIKALFITTKKLKHLIDFLKSTNVVTKRWILKILIKMWINLNEKSWKLKNEIKIEIEIKIKFDA